MNNGDGKKTSRKISPSNSQSSLVTLKVLLVSSVLFVTGYDEGHCTSACNSQQIYLPCVGDSIDLFSEKRLISLLIQKNELPNFTNELPSLHTRQVEITILLEVMNIKNTRKDHNERQL